MTALTIEALTSTNPAFAARVQVDDATGCWLWTGPRTKEQYGTHPWNGVRTTAHRVSYELLVAPIAEGLHVDHLCRNPPCVNPAHLEPVTPGENARRGVGPTGRWRLTECERGHEFTPENTLTRPNGTRHCRACHRDRERAARVRRAESSGRAKHVQSSAQLGSLAKATARANVRAEFTCRVGCGWVQITTKAGRSHHERACVRAS